MRSMIDAMTCCFECMHAHACDLVSVWLQHAKAYLRQRGGVNLRNPWGVCLAEMQTLCCIPLLLAALWLVWKFVALIWAVITMPQEGPPSGYHQAAQTQNYMQSFDEGDFSAAVDGQQSSTHDQL